MKKILIIAFSDLSKDPRVRRQIIALKGSYTISALGYENPNIEGVEFIKVQKIKWTLWKKVYQRVLLLIKAYDKVYNTLSYVIEAKENLKEINRFDLVIVNDIEPLPLVIDLNMKKCIVDLHEYAPKQYEDDFWWKFYFSKFKHYLCTKYLKKANYITTVSNGLRDEYQKEYNIKCEVFMSLPSFNNLVPSNVTQKIKLIHHGLVSRNRSLHLLIEMMDHVDERFELDLMLVLGQKDYFEELKNMAKIRKNVNIIPSVNYEDIIPFTNNYDMGVYILPPTNFNTKYMLPNKFFEFIQARLAIAIGPSLEMEQLVRKHNLGIVSESFKPEDLALLLNNLTNSEIINYKSNVDKTASILNSEVNSLKLNQIVSELLND